MFPNMAICAAWQAATATPKARTSYRRIACQQSSVATAIAPDQGSLQQGASQI